MDLYLIWKISAGMSKILSEVTYQGKVEGAKGQNIMAS